MSPRTLVSFTQIGTKDEKSCWAVALIASITVSHLSDEGLTRERNFLGDWDWGSVLHSFRA